MLRHEIRDEAIEEMHVASSYPALMQAAVYHSKLDVRVEERPVPELGPKDVLLEIDYCGICGSDLHFVLEGWGRPNSIGGHEYSGRIAALGSEVEGWSLGDAVVGGPEPGCGQCEYCSSHRSMLCTRHPTPGLSEFQGAFAHFMRVGADQLYAIPNGLGSREAALAEPLAVALHGITRSGILPGQSALVAGVGPIGMLTLAALLARGIDNVTVSEPAAERRILAEKIGATRVVAPGILETPEMPFQIADDAVSAAFECSGKAAAAEDCLALLRKCGTLVLQGTGIERPQLDATRVLLNELVVTGSYCYDEGGIGDALELLASGALPTDLLIHSEEVPLSGVQEAIERLGSGQIGGKILVAPRVS